jgi:hypothetical protein
MKKLIFVLFFLALIVPVFAQNNSGNNPVLYYINVPVERIFPSSEGYIIQYRNSSTIGTIGIPNNWFTDAAGRADLVRLPPGRDWPTMSIFYSDGEFSHIRLYVHRSKAHSTWGSIPQGTDVSRFFGDGDSFDIQY